MPKIPAAVPAAAKKQDPCRFTMFVKIIPGQISHFPGQERCWCFRGDRFADREHKMLRNLLNHFKGKIHLYQIVELYDNNKPREDPDRVIMKYQDGVIVENLLARYLDLLKGYPLPKILHS